MLLMSLLEKSIYSNLFVTIVELLSVCVCVCVCVRDKKARRAEKMKGKKKDEDGAKLMGSHSNHTPSSPTVAEVNRQDGEPIPDIPPICEEVGELGSKKV